jgi:hypothetical protein
VISRRLETRRTGCAQGGYTGCVSIISITELQQVDELSCVFTPAGAALLDEVTANRLHQQALAEIELVADVGPDTRAAFERLKATYAYGLLHYDLYTLVEQQARLLLELALRERFVTSHGGVATMVHDSVTLPVAFEWFDDLRAAMDARRGGWKVVTTSGAMVPFTASLHGLLDWARAERLLVGQRNRSRELAFVAMRNLVAHPEGFIRVGPTDALHTLNWLAETANHLWGHRTPDGHHYPTPIERVPVAVWRTSMGTTYADAAQLSDVDPAERGEDLRIVLVAGGVRSIEQAPFSGQVSGAWGLPATDLWGPGSWEAAVEWLAAHHRTTDLLDPLDQLFLVRLADPALLVRPQDAAALSGRDRAGKWLLVRADHPGSVIAHARHSLSGEPACDRLSSVRTCHVEQIAKGRLDDVLRRIGDDSSQSVPPVQTA